MLVIGDMNHNYPNLHDQQLLSPLPPLLAQVALDSCQAEPRRPYPRQTHPPLHQTVAGGRRINTGVSNFWFLFWGGSQISSSDTVL